MNEADESNHEFGSSTVRASLNPMTLYHSILFDSPLNQRNDVKIQAEESSSPPLFPPLSTDCHDLLLMLLEKDANKRMTIAGFQEPEFLVAVRSEDRYELFRS